MHSALFRVVFQLTAGITLFTLCGAMALRAQSVSRPDPALRELKANSEAGDLTGLGFGLKLQKGATAAAALSTVDGTGQSAGGEPEQAGPADKSVEVVKPTSAAIIRNSKLVGFNASIYHKNVLEFSLEGGWLPVNIPFVFDIFLGDGYTMTPLKYTLVPIIGSLRWQMDDVGGPLSNGNVEFDMTAPTGGSSSQIIEVTQTETPQTVWQMNISAGNAYRGYRIPSLYPGVTWKQ